MQLCQGTMAVFRCSAHTAGHCPSRKNVPIYLCLMVMFDGKELL